MPCTRIQVKRSSLVKKTDWARRCTLCIHRLHWWHQMAASVLGYEVGHKQVEETVGAVLYKWHARMHAAHAAILQVSWRLYVWFISCITLSSVLNQCFKSHFWPIILGSLGEFRWHSLVTIIVWILRIDNASAVQSYVNVTFEINLKP